MDDRYLSVDEISDYLGVKRDTVYKWIERRSLPAHKVGRLWKFRKREVDDWVSSESSGPHPKQHLPGVHTHLRRASTTSKGR